MSRRSKRRRMREGLERRAARAPEPADAFDFHDDRVVPPVPQAPPTPEPVKVVSGPPRMASVPARGRTTPPVAVEAPAPAPVPTPVQAPSPAATTAVLDAPTGDAPSIRPSKSQQTKTPSAPVAVPAPAPEPPPIGALLVAGREARGLSIGEASARTRISSRMLEHLENDRWNEFAADAYARGFLRSYASFLGLDVAMLLAQHEVLRGHTVPTPPEEEAWEPDVEAAPTPPRAPRAPLSRRTLAIVGGAVGVLVLGALGFYLANQGVLDLRPAAGLEQIEHELRQAQEPVTHGTTEPGAGATVTPAAPAADASTPPAVQGSAPVPGAVSAPVPVAPGPLVPQSAPVSRDIGPSAEDTSPGVPPLLRRDVGPPEIPIFLRRDATFPKPVTSPVASTPTVAQREIASAPPAMPREVAIAPPVRSPARADVAPASPARREDTSPAVPEPPMDLETPAARPAPAIDAGPLVLTATALDTCAVRLQIDAEGKRAQRWSFSSRGESRSWTARRNFRLVVHRAQNLELRLNGRLVPVPPDGRTVVLDHQTLGPVQQPMSTPKPRSARRARAARG